jgi:hypothetical protein
MNIVKKILNVIINPLNSVSFRKFSDKAVALFTKHPLLIVLVSLIVSAIIFIAYHANELF